LSICQVCEFTGKNSEEYEIDWKDMNPAVIYKQEEVKHKTTLACLSCQTLPTPMSVYEGVTFTSNYDSNLTNSEHRGSGWQKHVLWQPFKQSLMQKLHVYNRCGWIWLSGICFRTIIHYHTLLYNFHTFWAQICFCPVTFYRLTAVFKSNGTNTDDRHHWNFHPVSFPQSCTIFGPPADYFLRD